MNDHQLELWTADPHEIPPIDQELTPEQRCLLIEQLARLILKQVQAGQPERPNKSTHERP